MNNIDIKENHLMDIDERLLPILLFDNSSKKNIIWATDDYEELGPQYSFESEITADIIMDNESAIIVPRVEKSKEQQKYRSRIKAEVFTPSWVCNAQNNLVDKAWFGKEKGLFNTEKEQSWETNTKKITFPKNKTWQEYVTANRLEISCGEAPYLVSRYDSVTGEYIEFKNRIGLLDRKLRIVSENINDEKEWYCWAERAIKSTYGFDWQGDNVLLARENLLLTVIDAYNEKYQKSIDIEFLINCAVIISWNIWQMDGLKFVLPNSCKSEMIENISFFGTTYEEYKCEGCEKENNRLHNGIYALIKDWEKDEIIRFVDVCGG